MNLNWKISKITVEIVKNISFGHPNLKKKTNLKVFNET